jgi:hypothetical protein
VDWSATKVPALSQIVQLASTRYIDSLSQRCHAESAARGAESTGGLAISEYLSSPLSSVPYPRAFLTETQMVGRRGRDGDSDRLT